MSRMYDNMLVSTHSPELLREIDNYSAFYTSSSRSAWQDQPELNELASRMASQSLTCSSSRFATRGSESHFDPCDNYANTTDSDADWAIPVESIFAPHVNNDDERFSSGCSRARASTFPRPVSPAAMSYNASCRRAQRQRNTRLLCTSASHRREMEDLVAHLLNAQDDGAAAPPRSLSTDHNDVEGEDSPLSSEPASPDSGVWNAPSAEWSLADEDSDGVWRAPRTSRDSSISGAARPVPCVPSAAPPSARSSGPGVRKKVVVAKGKPRRSRTAS